MEPGAPQKGPKESFGSHLAGSALEGLFDLLFATEAGLVVFGVLALGVGLPLLVVALGAALAARARRKQSPRAPPIAVKTILLTPAVLLLAFLVLALFGGVSAAAFLSGHPVATALSYAAALVTLTGLGYWAMQRRGERA